MGILLFGVRSSGITSDPDQKGKQKRGKIRQFLDFFHLLTLRKYDHFLFISYHPPKNPGTANFDQGDKFLTSY